MKLTPAQRQFCYGLAFTSPWILGFLAFTLYPMGASLYYSFTSYNIGAPPLWVGWSNWSELLHDPLVVTALWNTILYTLVTVPLQQIAGIAIALILQQRLFGRAAWRTLFYLPSMVPTVVTSILWTFLFTPEGGMVNDVLAFLHLPQPAWLQSPNWALPALMLMSLWGVGSIAIIYLAGLQDMPRHLFEQAGIDGANGWHQFWSITIPLLSPIILLNTVLTMIASLQTFTQAYVMTQGGPVNATLLYPLYIFQTAFQFLNIGYAAALSWVLFALVLALTVLVILLSQRRVFYAS